ncbi:hypothetical protein ACFQY5_11490 [Paeniroseomonas aquatica]|uniref:hypothetical protein n=1 Tax=Paeniroseomonas aquatica TaxID=373043 RepID=UPI00360A476F
MAALIRSTLGRLPQWLAIDGANSALALAFGCFRAGAQRFGRRRPHLPIRLAGVLA